MQNANHTLAGVSNDVSNLARVSNDISNPIRFWHVSPWKSILFQPIKRCHMSWRKSLKAPPIKRQHMSPIRLHHMSFIHLQTPLNRSLPKAFLYTKTSRYKQHQRKFRSTQKYKSSTGIKPQAFKNFNLKIEEPSKQNHPNYLPRS